MNKPKIVVICGPTASGKTALSIKLAKEINGEIVSADSMQIYKDMNIGTAKPSIEEMDGIKHYLIDCISPDMRYSVADYKKDAKKAIHNILKEGKVPIIVGGTGLYIDSLLKEIEYTQIDIDLRYRKKLEDIIEKQGLITLYEMAKKIDPEAIKKISSNDKKRICRILEIYKATGENKTQREKKSRLQEPEFDYRVFTINMEREKLYERINKRVDLMMEQGLVKEVEELLNKYEETPTAIQGLGYKEVAEFLQEKTSGEEMVEKIKMETRRYAKRQITWFKSNKDTIWLNGLDIMQNNINIILEGTK